MAYSAATIANYMLKKAAQEGRSVTPMQLIKLVYIAHGWHLGYFDTPLISEPVQAWKYGPVINSLYHNLKHYGSGAISNSIAVDLDESKALERDVNATALIDHVLKGYSSYSAIQLSTLTHQPETPWSRTWKNGGMLKKSTVIPESEIKKHYKSKISEAR